MKLPFLSILLLTLIPIRMQAQHSVNYDESKVPALVLPDPFVSEKGEMIRSKEDWENIRKAEIFRLFEREVYGQIPRDFEDISFALAQENENPYPDLARLEEVDITIRRHGQSHTMRLNLFLPLEGEGEFPIILLINHRRSFPDGKLLDEGFWPVPELIKRGFATASFHAETVSPDDADRYQEGILNTLYPEQMEMADGMKAFGAWGWAAMRAMDYFEQHEKINSQKSVLVGHSRGGKTALWTSANDPRWAITYANESGCGGAALSRRKFGETVEIINSSFPHWFADNFRKYNGREESLPIDQHMLPGLIAPRAVYFASAKEDRWADPKGEFLSLKLGSRVYTDIYGQKIQFPEAFESITSPIHQKSMGYHYREGEHDLTWRDWEIFLEFVEINL
ncbi:glucuronyl esterase domain-containing protein [Algoriphagus namhaensis]